MAATVALLLVGPVAPAAAAAPQPPALRSPASGSSVPGTTATLSVTATDPDGGEVDTSFVGRKAGAPPVSTAAPFTFAVIPDTQNYGNVARQGMMTQQTQWLVDQRDTLDIAFVSQLGDLVGTYDYRPQWDRVSKALKVLDDAGVPNSVVPGNHDFNITTGLSPYYDQYFPPTRYSAASWNSTTTRYGGYLGQNLFGQDPVDRRNMDSFSLFTAGGRDFIVLNLEWEAPGYALDWGRKVLAAYPDRTAIFVTHSFITEKGIRRVKPQRPGGTSASALWTDFVFQQCSIALVLSGHDSTAESGENKRVDANRCGDPVTQIVTDYQDRPNGGDGWLRYYTFEPAANTITARTYSPTLGRYETDADSQFTLPFDLTGSDDDGFEPIGSIRTASGDAASVPWTGLTPDTAYEWKAIVTSGGETSASPVWSFRTGATPPPPPPPPAPTDLATDAFTRSVIGGWGAADAGGTWTTPGTASRYSVTGGAGQLALTQLGSTAEPSLPALPSPSVEVRADLAWDRTAAAGKIYSALIARRIDAKNDYRVKITVSTGDRLQLQLTRRVAGVETILATQPVAGTLVQSAGTPYTVVLRVVDAGSGATTVSAKVFPAGSTEPGWAITASDNTPALKPAGGVAFSSYLSSAATAPVTMRIDNLRAVQVTP